MFGTDAITDESRSRALSILHDFATQLPRAGAPQRLALDVATGVFGITMVAS